MSDTPLCRGTNLDGTRCTRHHTPGMSVCWWHHPDRVEERAVKLEKQAAEQAAALRASVVKA